MKTYKSYAKLNLFLHIVSKREDGFHNLNTCFQLIDYADTITFAKAKKTTLQITNNAQLSARNNLIIKATEAILPSNAGINVTLNKRIPLGAGLGGGSSNAATTLTAINELYELGYSQSQLTEIGKSIGADVAVFIGGKSAFATGIGEILQPVKLEKSYYLVVCPNIHSSTASVFANIQLTSTTGMLKIAPSCNRPSELVRYGNDLKEPFFKLNPELEPFYKIINSLTSFHLTGSGSAFFALCSNKEEAIFLKHDISKLNLPPNHIFIAKGINTGV